MRKTASVFAAVLMMLLVTSCASTLVFDESVGIEDSAEIVISSASSGTGAAPRLHVTSYNGVSVDWGHKRVRIPAGETRLTIDFAETYEIQNWSGVSIGGSGYVVRVKQTGMEIKFDAQPLGKNRYWTIAATGDPKAGINVSGGGKILFFPIDETKATLQRAKFFGLGWEAEKPFGQTVLKKQPQ